MRKSIFLAGFSLLFAASCSNEFNNEVVNNNTLVPVYVHVNDFAVTQEEFPDTRATEDVADYNDVNAVTLAFYKADGTEAYKTTQTKNEADFGEFSLSLPMGSYTW